MNSERINNANQEAMNLQCSNSALFVMSKAITRIFLSTVVVLLVSCTPEEERLLTQSGNCFTLSSSEEKAVTRAGSLSVKHFAEGTKYLLYGYESTDWSKPLSTMNGRVGTEVVKDGTNQIEYLNENEYEDRFDKRTLDFYALTYGDQTIPVCDSKDDKGVPICTIESDKGTLPDLRRAALTGQTENNSGVITLPFKHTLSKLKFEVVKQKTEGNSVLNSISLTGISVKDYREGSLLLSIGKYSHSGEKEDRLVYSPETPQSVTDTVSPVTINGKEVECLIFPTQENADKGLEITVTTKANDGIHENTYEISVPDADGKKNPFRFLPNYEYTLTIMITNDQVRVIAVVSQRYDWIDHNDDSQFLGQPLTFNGLMWMDRNLGATSADITTAQGWEKARGYLYQMGRSVPYYLKETVEYTGSDGKKYKRPASYVDKPDGAKPFPLVEGHMDDEFKMRLLSSGTIIARNPGDRGVFNFIKNNGFWSMDKKYNSYWDNIENDPCPKGWRVPTKADFDGIMPTTERYGDLTFIIHNNRGITWKETASDDPEKGYKTVYVCKRHSPAVGQYGTIYAIKYQGTSRAYRLMWTVGTVGDGQSVTENLSRYRTYVTISKFPCTKKDDLNEITCDTDYDWEHPSDLIHFPISGYIYTGYGAGVGLTNSGAEVVYATSTPVNENDMYGASFKFIGNTSHRYFTLYKMHKASGVSVRCVRDVTLQ